MFSQAEKTRFSDVLPAFHEGNLAYVARIVVWRLKNEGEARKQGMGGNARKSLHAKMSCSQYLMAVLAGAHGVFGVVEVDGPETVKAYGTVKGTQHSLKVVHDVVAGIKDMAGVEADAELVRKFHAFNDGVQFLEAASHFRAFAGHGFEEDGRLQSGCEDLVQRIGNEGDALFRTLSHVGAGVEVVVVAGQQRKALKVIPEHGDAVAAGCGGSGAEVHGVGGMGHKRTEVLLSQDGLQFPDIVRVGGPGFSASGIAGEIGKGAAAEGAHGFAHGGVAVGNGEVAANVDHGVSFLLQAVFLLCRHRKTGGRRDHGRWDVLTAARSFLNCSAMDDGPSHQSFVVSSKRSCAVCDAKNSERTSLVERCSSAAISSTAMAATKSIAFLILSSFMLQLDRFAANKSKALYCRY